MMGSLQEDVCIFMIISRQINLRMRRVSNVVEKIKKHILCSMFFKSWSGHGRKHDIAHVHFILDNKVYGHTHSEYVILIVFP